MEKLRQRRKDEELVDDMVFSDESQSQDSEETKTEFNVFPTSPDVKSDNNLNKTTIDNPQVL